MAKAKSGEPRNNAEGTPKRQMPEGRPFQPGNPGRPKGSRNKLGEAFVADLYASWQEHGAKTIETVRSEKPDQYLKVIASILPKELNVKVSDLDELSDTELDRRIRALAAALEIGVAGASEGEGASESAQSLN